MSKKNIIKREDIGKKVQITFDSADGQRVYEFSGSSARALRRGIDPSQLAGKLVEHIKPRK